MKTPSYWTSIHYEIAEVVDPQVNVVAKVKKAALAQISSRDTFRETEFLTMDLLPGNLS